ncbi:MAG: DUF4127 family protein, partial [Selenomonas sp.]|nr:DUF4127 family protein [Selenomonas sp.]
MAVMMIMPAVSARHKEVKPDKILFIPHDNRPISDKQTAEVVKKLGYDVVVPPDNILGDRDNLGDPNALWTWLDNNALEAKAAVISSDSLVYGSLVGSRKHNYSRNEVAERVERFSQFRKANPKMSLYVFGSIMRTPRSGEASGHEEPAYYRSYGSDIFRYTVLKDKEEVEGLSRRENKEKAFLEELIPQKNLSDWLGRRAKNFAVNEDLIRLTRKNVFDYLVLGRDDNAPYSQTHLESRHLNESGKDLDKTKVQTMAGIDEMAMLLLARAVNNMRQETPAVYTRYNWGCGPYPVPAYSDEKISISIRDAITAAGGEAVTKPEQADLVMMVNTNPNGKTYEANERNNDGEEREGTQYFADLVSEYVGKGYPVGIADIAFANGSDNALMEQLRKRNLLFKIRAYSGWNTPTNSSGFLIGEGMLVRHMKKDDVDALLLTRYLDDWAYQANVRNTIARQLTWLRGDGVYGSLDTKREAVSLRTQKMLSRFASQNLPALSTLEEIHVYFPWNRMF